MINLKISASVAALSFSIVSASLAQDAPQPTLITNVHVFDGVSEARIENANVLIEGNLIAAVSTGPIEAEGATIIDGGGRTLMPGLSDNHTHLAFATIPQGQLFTGFPGYSYVRSTRDASDMLMRGVTSVRDMGGDVFGLKQAIDEGIVPGPRIYPTGAAITQTAGHFDFRFRNQEHPQLGGNQTRSSIDGHNFIVDGVPLMLSATRENLRKGASHIKLAAGGGYSSPADPLLGNQFTFEEMKAAADAAGDWGTYVTIHAYHPSAVNRAIDAGIKDIGHGQLLGQETLQRMADEGVILSTQPFTECSEPQLDAFSNAKLALVCQGTEQVYKLSKEIPELTVTYGTDLFFVPGEVFSEQTRMMERLLPWFEPVEILRMATSNMGKLFKMSGPDRDPYTAGALGIVEEGAYADLLLVDGNPLEDLSAVTDVENIKIIMKDGVIYKNTLE